MALRGVEWKAAKRIFEAALRLQPSLRRDFIDRRVGNPNVRTEVHRLLASYGEMGSFLAAGARRRQGAVRDAPRLACNPGDILANRFRIVRFIALGGMAEV